MESETIAMRIIASAGDSKAVAFDALEAAKNNDFDKNKISEFRKTQFNSIDGEASKRVVDFLLNDGGKNG